MFAQDIFSIGIQVLVHDARLFASCETNLLLFVFEGGVRGLKDTGDSIRLNLREWVCMNINLSHHNRGRP
jgi:hypothetical protein